MPELPEVETLRRELRRAVVGKTIKTISCNWPKMIRPFSVRQLQARLRGKKITRVERRAKVLIFDLSDKSLLLVHLKMTGQLIFVPRNGQLIVGGHPQKDGLGNLPNKYTHLVFTFSDQSHLYFNDLRKFGWVKLVSNDEFEGLFSDTGVEPLSKDFTLKLFKEIIGRYPKRKIKQLLLDQNLVAGIGNIYADEACFAAKVLPSRIVGTLKPKEVKDLHRAIVDILRLSIKHKGTSARNYRRSDGSQGNFVKHLKVYGRGSEVCKRCGHQITKIKQHGRGTHYCSHCQK